MIEILGLIAVAFLALLWVAALIACAFTYDEESEPK